MYVSPPFLFGIIECPIVSLNGCQGLKICKLMNLLSRHKLKMECVAVTMPRKEEPSTSRDEKHE